MVQVEVASDLSRVDLRQVEFSFASFRTLTFHPSLVQIVLTREWLHQTQLVLETGHFDELYQLACSCWPTDQHFDRLNTMFEHTSGYRLLRVEVNDVKYVEDRMMESMRGIVHYPQATPVRAAAWLTAVVYHYHVVGRDVDRFELDYRLMEIMLEGLFNPRHWSHDQNNDVIMRLIQFIHQNKRQWFDQDRARLLDLVRGRLHDDLR